MKLMHRIALLGVSASLAVGIAGGAVLAAGGHQHVERHSWSFGGIAGQFDQAQLQRGFQVYKEVCAACHSIKRLSFRELAQPNGPEFPEAQVKALAEEYQIKDGPNDQGEMFDRPGRLSDKFPPLYANDNAARAIHNGALPPDLSLITEARGIPHPEGVFRHVLTMASDIVTGYQEGGVDYVSSLLAGYKDPPEGFQVQDGLYYNVAFPGNQIAMAPPLSEGQVSYQDGTPGTVEQYSKDVAAFLAWAADPSHDQRKQMGWVALLYLLLTAALLYVSKRIIWSKVHH